MDVLPEDEVWEVMYRYYNAEVSVPEPERRQAGEIPKGVKIWKSFEACKSECRRLNTRKERDKKISYDPQKSRRQSEKIG
jgi:hypothetical protein